MAVLLLLPTVAISAKLGCVTEAGEAVDWWFLYKHPRWADKSHAECIGDCNGNAYVYASSASPSSWTVGKHTVAETSSLLGLQLAGIYDGSITNYVFYNDQLPDGGYSSTYGHSKGFFAYDDTSAFFVQHSIPDFPNYVEDGYLYGTGQMYYGQHAFCMTLTPKALDEIAVVMRYANPQVYASNLDITSWPNIAAVAAQEKLQGSTSTTVDVGWATLHLQGKASAADEDMLDSLTAPALKVDLSSQSWLNSGGPIGGYCPSKGYNVTDVQTITLPPTDTHVTYVDHSKWAVAKLVSANWFCALDNNHVESQERRSGLAVCMQQAGLVGLMHAAAAQVGGCGAPSPPSPGPTPGPTPTPGSCCFYNDVTCSPGQTCCSGSGVSYKSESTCQQYGEKHGCVWQDDVCEIPGGGGECAGAGAYPCSTGCVYVHSANEGVCGVAEYGCYACSALAAGCPECAVVESSRQL